jgi:hypothetical protein
MRPRDRTPVTAILPGLPQISCRCSISQTHWKLLEARIELLTVGYLGQIKGLCARGVQSQYFVDLAGSRVIQVAASDFCQRFYLSIHDIGAAPI